MRRLGEITRTAQGLAIARSPDETVPEIGEAVVDESLDKIGRVVDVFGPVSRPYVAISPDDRDELVSFVGRKVYVR